MDSLKKTNRETEVCSYCRGGGDGGGPRRTELTVFCRRESPWRKNRFSDVFY